MDHRHPFRQRCHQPGRMRLHIAPVVLRRKATHPTVEQLQGLGAGRELAGQEADGAAHDLFHQRIPGALVAVHEALGMQEVSRSAAFHKVGRHGKGCPGETDERNGVHQVLAGLTDGIPDIAEVAVLHLPQAVHIFASAHRRRDGGSLTLQVFQFQAQWFDDEQQIRKDDGRIHAQGFGRMHGDLTDQIRGLAKLQHRYPGAHPAVLLHVAAGLTHQPQRRPGCLLPAAGAHEGRLIKIGRGRLQRSLGEAAIQHATGRSHEG